MTPTDRHRQRLHELPRVTARVVPLHRIYAGCSIVSSDSIDEPVQRRHTWTLRKNGFLTRIRSLREGNVFSRVCMSVDTKGIPVRHGPPGLGCTLDLIKLIQLGIPHAPATRPVQTCSLGDHHPPPTC